MAGVCIWKQHPVLPEHADGLDMLLAVEHHDGGREQLHGHARQVSLALVSSQVHLFKRPYREGQDLPVQNHDLFLDAPRPCPLVPPVLGVDPCGVGVQQPGDHLPGVQRAVVAV